MKITLIDGPYEGVKMEAEGGGSVLMTGQLPDGTELPEDKVARYRPTRDKKRWRFKGWDTVVARLELPGAEA